jgi:hypothetical protein
MPPGMCLYRLHAFVAKGAARNFRKRRAGALAGLEDDETPRPLQ